MVLSLFLCLPLWALTKASTFNIPPPNGTYGVDVKALELIDTSRLDPYAPKAENRSLMVSVFYPSRYSANCTMKFAQYLPNATAAFENQQLAVYGIPNGTVEALRLSLCPTHETTLPIVRQTPVVLFSPGLGTSRLFYSALAQSVASQGYIVVTVDHPYGVDVVEYPDGRLVFGANISTEAQIEFEVETRTQDIDFVTRAMSNPQTFSRVFPAHNGTFQAHTVAMYGHSLGGATSAAAMLNNSRITGGVNLDGEPVGPVLSQGLSRPFLIFNHENATNPGEVQLWQHLDWRLRLMLANSTHGTFTDFPVLAQVAGLASPLPPSLGQIIGTIPEPRGQMVIATYLVAFFDMVLRCKPSGLLQSASPAYPEVTFVDPTTSAA
ncbi:MAG: hypothetical protein LQ340_007571 [Diploschistes diacapsis]|nr:MAG: hypothetical protein LQ340_007571 [Diploschistes diacapsis]